MAKKDFKKNTAELFISSADQEATQEKAEVSIDQYKPPKGYKLIREYKSERMQLLVRPTLKEAMKKEAKKQGLSMNDLANTIFEEYLERNGIE